MNNGVLIQSKNTMVKVMCGANVQDVNAGMTVGQIKDEFGEVLNLDDQAKTILNGQEVDDDYTVQENDSLEFVKPAGDKGTK